MIIQATRYGTAKQEEPFAFTYSGDFTDERVDGIGDVTLNTSGQLVTSGKTVTVQAYILGAGGGAALNTFSINYGAGGGGGGIQTIEVTLEPGTYDIVIGTGGNSANEYIATADGPKAGGGGNTIAFNKTSMGGEGGNGTKYDPVAGQGGAPNGSAGDTATGSPNNAAGGSPNGGAVVNGVAQNGGDGLVRITFS